MPAAASLHCLVVDDQMTMRSLVRTSLQQLGVREIRESLEDLFIELAREPGEGTRARSSRTRPRPWPSALRPMG